MTDISKGHIYIIICIQNPKIYYIGSTFNQLRQRWKHHKDDYNKSNNNRPLSIYKYFDKYGIDNFTMKLLKSYDVVRTHSKDTNHLRAYEQLWINKMKSCCNKLSAFMPLTKKYLDKEYREQNKEKIRKKKKEYFEKNKEKISEKAKEYREKNKDKISEKDKDKITCECGCIINKRGLLRHQKNQKHLNLLKKKH